MYRGSMYDMWGHRYENVDPYAKAEPKALESFESLSTQLYPFEKES